MRNWTRWTPEEEAELVRLLKTATRKEIARTLNRSLSSVRKVAARLGYSFEARPNKPVKTTDIRQTARMTSLGMSCGMIAVVLGRTPDSIRRIRAVYHLDLPARPHTIHPSISERAFSVLVSAAARCGHDGPHGPARVASAVIEIATSGSHDLWPHVLPKAPPRREPAPMSSLFSVALEARA
jgi:hypothetical protein